MGAKSQGFKPRLLGQGGLSKGLNRNFGTTLGSVFVRDKNVCVQLGKPQYGGTKVGVTDRRRRAARPTKGERSHNHLILLLEKPQDNGIYLVAAD